MSDSDGRDEPVDHSLANARREFAADPPSAEELSNRKESLEVFIAAGRALVAAPQQPGVIAKFMKAAATAADAFQIDDGDLLDAFESANNIAHRAAGRSSRGTNAETFLEKSLVNGFFYEKFSEFPYVQVLLLASQLGENITPYEAHTLGSQIEFAIEARRSPFKRAASTDAESKPS